jgi:AmiR/NasT family two-component response regulator
LLVQHTAKKNEMKKIIQAGMSGYLEKPIKKNDLYELVERYLV